METLDAIKTRRSIRKFKPQLISRETIKELLEAAMFAPSAGNEQPWQFVVLDDRTILDEVPRICSTASMCRQSTTAVLVCGDATLEKYPGFWALDCSAAVENLLACRPCLGFGGGLGWRLSSERSGRGFPEAARFAPGRSPHLPWWRWDIRMKRQLSPRGTKKKGCTTMDGRRLWIDMNNAHSIVWGKKLKYELRGMSCQ